MIEFKLPDIGEGTVEGEIVRWLVKPGDKVKADQPVVEVMTDKATVELTAPRAGTIQEMKVEAGKVAKVGSVIYTLAEDGDGAAAKAAPQAEKNNRDSPRPAARAPVGSPGPQLPSVEGAPNRACAGRGGCFRCVASGSVRRGWRRGGGGGAGAPSWAHGDGRLPSDPAECA